MEAGNLSVKVLSASPSLLTSLPDSFFKVSEPETVQPSAVVMEGECDNFSDTGKSTCSSISFSSPNPSEHDDTPGSDRKRRKKLHDSSIVLSTPKSGGSSTRLAYPLSERQQMALLMQMTAPEQGLDSPRSPSLSTGTPTTAVQGNSASTKTAKSQLKIHKRNQRGETPLHIAAIKGDHRMCKDLIKKGAEVNAADYAGWTPLHEACNHGWYETAKVLVKHGANVSACGADDDTPLHDASSSGHHEIARLLVRHGADAFKVNKEHQSPVDVAIDDDMIAMLTNEKGSTNPDYDSNKSIASTSSSMHSDLEDDDHTLVDSSKLSVTTDSDVEHVGSQLSPAMPQPKSKEGTEVLASDVQRQLPQSLSIAQQHVPGPIVTKSVDYLERKTSADGTSSGGATLSKAQRKMMVPPTEPVLVSSSLHLVVPFVPVVKPITSTVSFAHVVQQGAPTDVGISKAPVLFYTDPISPPAIASQPSTSSSISTPDLSSVFAPYKLPTPTKNDGSCTVISPVKSSSHDFCTSTPISSSTVTSTLSTTASTSAVLLDSKVPILPIVSLAGSSALSTVDTSSAASLPTNEHQADMPAASCPPSAMSETPSLTISSLKVQHHTSTPFRQQASLANNQHQAGLKKSSFGRKIIPKSGGKCGSHHSSSHSYGHHHKSAVGKAKKQNDVYDFHGSGSEDEGDSSKSMSNKHSRKAKSHAAGKAHVKVTKTLPGAQVEPVTAIAEPPVKEKQAPPRVRQPMPEPPIPKSSDRKQAVGGLSLPRGTVAAKPPPITLGLTSPIQSPSTTKASPTVAAITAARATNEASPELGTGRVGLGMRPFFSESALQTMGRRAESETQNMEVSLTEVPTPAPDPVTTMPTLKVPKLKIFITNTGKPTDQQQPTTLTITPPTPGGNGSVDLTGPTVPASVFSTVASSSTGTTTTQAKPETANQRLTRRQLQLRNSRKKVGAALDVDSSGYLHPRKRKFIQNLNSDKPEVSNEASEEVGSKAVIGEDTCAELTARNSFDGFRGLRKMIESRWNTTQDVAVKYKIPSNFDQFLMNNRQYLLQGNLPTPKLIECPSPDLPESLKLFFQEQEAQRLQLTRRMQVDREKLILSCEMDTKRVYNRYSRALVGASVPFTFMRMLRDQDCYNPMQLQKPPIDADTSWSQHVPIKLLPIELQKVLDSHNKLKTKLISRHQMEIDSLYAVQCMDWESKCRPLGTKLSPFKPDLKINVQRLGVVDNFNLLPAE